MSKLKVLFFVFTCVLATAFAVQAQAETARPLSASGCAGSPVDEYPSGETCFNVNGSGLHVSSVSSTFSVGDYAPACVTLHITVSPSQHPEYFPFNQQTCGDKYHHTYKSGNINFNTNFRNNTRICAHWASGPSAC